MAVLNATVRRFESGGVLLIGADTVSNTMAGTLKIMPPRRQPLEYKDRGVCQVPLEGDAEYGECEIQVKGGKYNATELFEALLAQASPASNLVKTYDITVKIPEHAASAAGEQFAMTNCFVAADSPSYAAGADFDTVTLKFRFIGLTISTY